MQTLANETREHLAAYGVEVRIFDNGGKTFDRYTIYFTDYVSHDLYSWAVTSSVNPTSPQGFWQHGDSLGPDAETDKEIKLSKLPEDVLTQIWRELSTYGEE